MNRKILISLLIVFFILNSFLIYKLKWEARVPSSKEKVTEQVEQHDHPNETHANLLRGRILLQAKYNDIVIDKNANIMDTTGKEIPLSQAVSGKENMVFFFTNYHCYTCIDEAIPVLEELAKEIGYDKIFLLGSMNEKRDILSFKVKYKSKLRIYSIDTGAISGDATKLNFPFSFLLNKNLSYSTLFYIEKELPDVTMDFIKEMKRHFLEQ